MLNNHQLSILVSTVSALVAFTFPVVAWWFSDNIVPVYFIVLALVGSTLVGDYLTSTATVENVQRMRDHGFSTVGIWATFGFNFLTFQLPYLLLLTTIKETAVFSVENVKVVPIGLLIGLSSDFWFYAGHRLLHDYLPELHKMHHCCIRTSATTNLFFHPGDLAIEFTAPILWTYFMSVYAYGDPFAFVISSCLIGGWYTMSHDENAQLQHSRHHRHIGTNYFIYINWWKEKVSYDKVRPLVK
jgi:sterol desaturase/sphingolipid hydroxylase (fatty acid hydroxylase superfamily)